MVTCPKCGFEQSDGGAECIRCGVIFAKVHAPEERHREIKSDVTDGSVPLRIRPWLTERIFSIEPEENRFFLIGRGIFLLLLGVWGGRLVAGGIQSNLVGESFMHLINLPFHEAGHILFSPFGRLVQVLGGTLGQWLIPFIVLCAFIAKGNPFGATVGLWWLGESFLDIAPYMNDARAGQLMLLGGVTGSEVEDYHDWEVILTKLGWLQYDHLIARISFTVGVMLMILAMIWGGYILFRQAGKTGEQDRMAGGQDAPSGTAT